MCVDGRGLSKALSFKPSASLRGACKLGHYITRGVMSRPNLSQWTIPLPEFMLCPEEEAGETKQTCGEVYRFWGESITKHCVKDFLRPRNIVLVVGHLAELIFFSDRTVTHPGLRTGWMDERGIQKSPERTREKDSKPPFRLLKVFLVFKCWNISKHGPITKDTFFFFTMLCFEYVTNKLKFT